MPTKFSRHNRDSRHNQTGLEPSQRPPLGSDRHNDGREDLSGDSLSRTPRSITYAHSKKVYHIEAVKSLGPDGLDDERELKSRERSNSRGGTVGHAGDISTYPTRPWPQQRIDTSLENDIDEDREGGRHFSLEDRSRHVSRHDRQLSNVRIYTDEDVQRQWPRPDPRETSTSIATQAQDRFATRVPRSYLISNQDSEQSCLSNLAKLFAKIEVSALSECETFITNQPAVLKEDSQLFLCQAALAYEANDKQYARSCVHRAVLINKCRSMDEEELEDYLADLTAKHRSTTRAFIKDVDLAYDGMRDNLSHFVTGARTFLAKSAPSAQAGYVGGPSELVRPRRLSAYSGTAPSSSNISEPFSVLAIRPSDELSHLASVPESSNTDRHGQQLSHRNQKPVSGTQGSRASVQPGEHLAFVPESSNTDRHGQQLPYRNQKPVSGTQGSRASVQPGEYDIRGTPGEVEKLDSRYRQQKRPADYFVFGKVFAILWHENVGNPGKRSIDPAGKYGEEVFSKIRRMVVVKARKGYCWCVSISTYSGRGVAQKRRGDDELRAHTIVYDSKKHPVRYTGEEGIVKEPIAIIMNPGHDLDPRSRLNFAKVFTVEHNVKVMPVGKVADEDLPYLKAYWISEQSED